jgi:hypothetical protein
MMARLVREPFVHFAVLGAAVFIAYHALAPASVNDAEIVVTADRIAALGAQFSGMHNGRPPNDEELRGLIDRHVQDEMLYRDAIALGLDRDDPVVRNRILQKAEILRGDALTVEPDDADLQRYLDAHQNEFDIPARVSFEQVYFDPSKDGNNVTAVVARARRALASGAVRDVGDRTLLPSTMSRVSPGDISAQFGDGFSQSLADIHDTAWHGPITTTFGVHLVRITWRGEPTRATLDNARVVVAREWSRAHAAEMKARFYRELASRYTVRVESAAKATPVATRAGR